VLTRSLTHMPTVEPTKNLKRAPTYNPTSSTHFAAWANGEARKEAIERGNNKGRAARRTANVRHVRTCDTCD
jgi:hypothetical protein